MLNRHNKITATRLATSQGRDDTNATIIGRSQDLPAMSHKMTRDNQEDAVSVTNQVTGEVIAGNWPRKGTADIAEGMGIGQ